MTMASFFRPFIVKKHSRHISGVIHCPYKPEQCPQQFIKSTHLRPFPNNICVPELLPYYTRAYFRTFPRIFPYISQPAPSIFHSLLLRKNGSFVMFNMVILMTIRHCTFNGWMDWGSIKCVNIKKSQKPYLK